MIAVAILLVGLPARADENVRGEASLKFSAFDAQKVLIGDEAATSSVSPEALEEDEAAVDSSPAESSLANSSRETAEKSAPNAAFEFPPLLPSSMLADAWVVNTRATAYMRCGTEAASRVRFQRQQACRWIASDLHEFLSTSEPWRPIVIWVHGNNTSEEEARQSGWQIYRTISRGHAEPIRFIIWSWPSLRMSSRVVRDLRIKAGVSDAQGYYLAWLFEQLPPRTPVVLLGYSYGTRVVSSGLNIAGTPGPIAEGATVSTNENHLAARVMLIAAAQDNHSFLPCCDYANAPYAMSQLTVLFNTCDPVLHWYTRLEGPGGPPALGRTGLARARSVPLAPWQIQQVNVADAIGIHHSLDNYLDSSPVMTRLRRFVYAPNPEFAEAGGKDADVDRSRSTR